MDRTELSVAVLWHMHQPDYVDDVQGRSVMPWVRLHALFSYFDTLRALTEVPDARAVFNLVPTLLRQLEDLAAGGIQDDFALLARTAPADLGENDRRLLLRHFFAFNHARRFPQLPRLAELFERRNRFGPAAADWDLREFTEQDLLDLQVGFHLAWAGRTLREEERIRGLFKKGRNFSEQDKHDLLTLQQEFLGRVIPAYRQAAGSGSLEVSCTPFAHPILPLLCDLQSAREAVPDLPLPASDFQFPGDAWYHVNVGLAEMERFLGQRPVGMWPAEGSISEQAVRIFETEKVQWIASDQDVLTASLAGQPAPAGLHFQPFRFGGDAAPAIFFRDRGLSDRIGFVYAAWEPRRAAEDLVGLLLRIRSGLPAGRFLVPIILDGENPWESYADGGTTFLRELYTGVASQPGLAWTTFAEFLAEQADPVPSLDRLRAGSWIRSDFTTWIGHPQKNAGWDRLGRVRGWLQGHLERAGATRPVALAGSAEPIVAADPQKVGPGQDSPLARAWQAMVKAEGSDWFWWYGDDNPTEFAVEFDSLFRTHLANVYRHLDTEPDPVLHLSLLDGQERSTARPARLPLQVTLDGRPTSYLEWLDAGRCEAIGGGAMHRTTVPVTDLFFGADPEHLFLRLDPEPSADPATLVGLALVIQLVGPGAEAVQLELPERFAEAGPLDPQPGDGRTAEPACRGCFESVVEIAVPWRRLRLAPGDSCEFLVALRRGDQTELVLPAVGNLSLRVPRDRGDSDDWLV